MAWQQYIYEGTTNSIEWKSRIVVDLEWQDVDNAVSNITVYFQFARSRSSSYAYNGSDSTATIVIDGTTYNITVPAYNYSVGVNDWKTIAVKKVDVAHDTTGYGYAVISASWSQSGIQPSSCSAGGTTVFPTIPRASRVTCNDCNIGSSTTINISRASSSFTHTLRYKFGSLTGNIAVKTGDTSVGWILPTAFYSQVPNSKTGAFEIFCDTYSGNTLIGTNSYAANCFVTNSEPVITATFEDITPITLSLTGDKNKIIKGVSTVRVKTSATAKNSASIKSIDVRCSDGKSKSGVDVEINWPTQADFYVTVTDSRGFSVTITKKMTMIEYIEPAITDLNFARLETTSPLTKISVRGNVYSGSFGAVQNARKLTYQWMEDGETTWSSEIILAPTEYSNGQFTYEANLALGFNINKSYVFFVKIQDKVHVSHKYFTIGKSIPLILAYKDKIDLNGEMLIGGNKIVDRGKNTNGMYIRYSDGTQICTNTVSFSSTLNNSNGSMFSSLYGNLLGDFAKPFAGDASEIFITGSITSGGAAWAFNSQLYNTTTTNAGAVYLFRPSSTGTQTYKFTYNAVGRWK